MNANRFTTACKTLGLLFCATVAGISAQARPTDPGLSTTTTNAAPAPLTGTTSDEIEFFNDGLARFVAVETVAGSTTTQGSGLGARFNSDQCSSCHSQPTIGGSSPALNPLLLVAHVNGATNRIPWFIAANGPIREARFIQTNGEADGGVHDLFVVTGRSDAGACDIVQPNFLPAGNPVTGQGGNRNIVFRIPTPIFGAGLIEAISDSTILANGTANAAAKGQAGVIGHPNAIQGGNVNRSGNDGTITRFGWKGQNKSLLQFAGEAYNVEMGVSNQLFPQERDETANCSGLHATPNDTTNYPVPGTAMSATAVLSDLEAFANFMRMLAPPVPAAPTPSTQNGRALFASVGCALCHAPSLKTGAMAASGSYRSPSIALSNQTANLFSDLLLHHMGKGLSDGITQGAAGPDEFRTAPLWGLGARAYFLHDGRTSDVVAAIYAHASAGSEANQVVANFASASPTNQQDLVNFLRSL
jgi:CxxC motif-containing protein (DUF1111 family)